MLNPFSPHRLIEVCLSRRAEKALLRQAKAHWVGTRDGLKTVVREYLRRRRNDEGLLMRILRSSAFAAATALLALQLYATPVDAATPTFNNTGVTNPYGLSTKNASARSLPAMADLDNDGDIDLLAGDFLGNYYYFRNSGTATNPAFSTIPSVGIISALPVFGNTPALVDLDNDGDYDLVRGVFNGGFFYYKNTGDATNPLFATSGSSFLPSLGTGLSYPTPTFADLDNDGDFDLMGGRADGTFFYSTNTGSAGTPGFAGTSNNPFGLTDIGLNAAPTFKDLDDDGDLDMVSGDSLGGFHYFENTGTKSNPAFVERAASDSPLQFADAGAFSAPLLADLDGNGTFDLVSGNSVGEFIVFENTTVTPAHIDVSPSSVAFGGVAVGDSAEQVLTVSNEGGDTLIVGGGGLGDLFDVKKGEEYDASHNLVNGDFNVKSDDPFKLPGGHSLELTFTFAPVFLGTALDTLNFNTNDANNSLVKIPFSGTGTGGSGPQIAVIPPSLNFGEVELGASENRVLTVASIGTETMTVVGQGLDAPFGFDHIEEFDGPTLINANVALAQQFSVAPGHVLKLFFNFTPATQGAVTDTVTLVTNDPGKGQVKVPFSGTGFGDGAPEISVNLDQLDFGNAEVGTSQFRMLSVSNTGSANLTFDASGQDHPAFTFDHAEERTGNTVTNNDVQINPSSPINLAPGHSLDLHFTFAPTSEGVVRDTLKLSTNDTDEGFIQIPFVGTGTPGQSVFGTRLIISNVFVGPNATSPKLDISLVNSTNDPVGGLQFDIDLRSVQNVTFANSADEILESTALEGFQVKGNLLDNGNKLRIAVFTTGDYAIAPAAVPKLLTRMSYTAGSSLGTETPINIIPGSLIVSDPNGNLLGFGDQGGSIQVGIPSDVNLDSRVDVRDIVVLIAEIVGRQSFVLPTDPGRVAFKIQNANNDGGINVADAVFIINQILGLPTTPISKQVAGAPVALSFGTTVTLPDGQTALPVAIVGNASIAGLQATFTFDPSLVKVGTAQAVGANQNLLIDSKVTGGQLRVVVLGLTAQGLPGSGQPILYIPINLLGEQDGALTVSALTMVNRSAQTLEVVSGVISQTITKGVTTPRAFALQGAHPNPFNPSTEIAYEVPAQAQITLAVYNLLGQEVVTLVNQVQPAGHYTVRWDARNAHGQAVSSGVYLYRLVSSTGFTSTRRMTLLK